MSRGLRPIPPRLAPDDLDCGVVLMFGDPIGNRLMVMAIMAGHSNKALSAFAEISGRDRGGEISMICLGTWIVGESLGRLYVDVFEKDVEALEKALFDLSHNRLCEIRSWLESGDDFSMSQAKLALGVEVTI